MSVTNDNSLADQVRVALAAPLGRLARLDAAAILTASNEINVALLEAQAALAAMRRAAVRDLRLQGYTLTEIGQKVGLAPQRIHQIETGFDRHEKKRRKQQSS